MDKKSYLELELIARAKVENILKTEFIEPIGWSPDKKLSKRNSIRARKIEEKVKELIMDNLPKGRKFWFDSVCTEDEHYYSRSKAIMSVCPWKWMRFSKPLDVVWVKSGYLSYIRIRKWKWLGKEYLVIKDRNPWNIEGVILIGEN